MRSDPFFQLSLLLRNDRRLRQALPMRWRNAPRTARQARHAAGDWCRRTHGLFHVIIVDGKVAGSISLSRVNQETARIGYMLASRCWNRGITTHAFTRILTIAQSLGAKRVVGTIAPENHASRRIWLKHGAVVEGDVAVIELKG